MAVARLPIEVSLSMNGCLYVDDIPYAFERPNACDHADLSAQTTGAWGGLEMGSDTVEPGEGSLAKVVVGGHGGRWRRVRRRRGGLGTKREPARSGTMMAVLGPGPDDTLILLAKHDRPPKSPERSAQSHWRPGM